MTIDFMSDYMMPVIVGICLCIGYILKNLIPSEKVDKYIPAMCALIGLGLAVWMHWPAVTPEVILMGLFSGLASTGLHQAFKQTLGK